MNAASSPLTLQDLVPSQFLTSPWDFPFSPFVGGAGDSGGVVFSWGLPLFLILWVGLEIVGVGLEVVGVGLETVKVYFVCLLLGEVLFLLWGIGLFSNLFF